MPSSANMKRKPPAAPPLPGEQAKKLRSDFRLTQSVLARLLGVSIRTVSILESNRGQTVEATLRKLQEVRRLFAGLGDIMRADYVATWLDQPNDELGKLKPIEVIERGEVDRVWRLIFHVGSGEPL